MYRAVALAGLRLGLDWDRPDDLAALAKQLSIELVDDRVLLDGEDVSQAIRTQEVTAVTRYSASNPEIRAHLVALQQAMAGDRDVVTEGRDQGTVAFADAECKIFLTASPEERARRRLEDLRDQGESATLQDVLQAQQARDRRDAAREVGPLAKAPDAVDLVTDGLSIDQVVDRLVEMVEEKAESGKRKAERGGG